MTKDPDEVEVLNPRYQRATPGMVAKALARPVKKADQEDDGDKPENDTQPPGAQSSI